MTKDKPSLMFLHHVAFQALCAALDLDPEDWKTSFRIRQSFVNPTPPPPPEGENVLYFYLTPAPGRPLTETLPREAGPGLYRFAAYDLRLTFYGPDAESVAWQIYHGLFLDGRGSPRQLFRLHRLYPVPSPEAPSLVWEEWQKQHRLRADLTIRLMAAINASLPAKPPGQVTEAPEILPDAR